MVYVDVSSRKDLVALSEQHTVQYAEKTFLDGLHKRSEDIKYLGQQRSIREWANTLSTESIRAVGTDFVAFIKNYSQYDQLRLLDVNGREVVRVDNNANGPVLIPGNKLQDKSGRYYAETVARLSPGDIYMSPIDLNVEYGEIEQPIKPVLRVGLAIFDSNGKRMGAIILNYLIEDLFSRIKNIHANNDRELWLLNSEGYWLLGPEKLEWQFMYSDGEMVSFPAKYPDLWPYFRAGSKSGMANNDDGFFSYQRFGLEGIDEGGKARTWILISIVPKPVYFGFIAPNIGELIAIYIVFVLLLSGSVFSLSFKDRLRKQSESQLRERERQYRNLLDSAPDAIVIVDESGEIQLVNDEVITRFGYDREELLGANVDILVPDNTRSHHAALRDSYTRAPSVRPMGASRALFARRKDGSEFPVEISLSPSHNNGELYVTSIIRDVTERKKREEVYLQEQERYKHLVTHIPISVFRLSSGPQNKIQDANPTMINLFQADSLATLAAVPFSQLFAQKEDLVSLMNHLAAKGLVNGYEAEMVTLSGEKFFSSITAIVMREGDGGMYINSIIENISARRTQEEEINNLNQVLLGRQQELENLNRELEAFSYSVSHDLRAPLRAMDGFSQSLLRNYADVLDEQGVDRLSRIRAGAQRMAQLIDDLLMLSRISRYDVKSEEVDMGKMVHEIFDDIKSQDNPQRDVTMHVMDNLYVKADSHLLHVALTNLLSNAYKFTGHTENAEITVGVMLEKSECVYYVKDNGAGFNMDYAEKLFGAFQRLHDTHEFPGTGIGLATVQRVVHKHGGRIWADAEEGQGATFYFTLCRSVE